jgi:hypothetical protein
MDAVGSDTHKLPPAVDVQTIDDLTVQLTGFVVDVDGAPSVSVSVPFFSPLVDENVQESLPGPAD